MFFFIYISPFCMVISLLPPAVTVATTIITVEIPWSSSIGASLPFLSTRSLYTMTNEYSLDV
jgi:hypothetical protein